MTRTVQLRPSKPHIHRREGMWICQRIMPGSLDCNAYQEHTPEAAFKGWLSNLLANPLGDLAMPCSWPSGLPGYSQP